MKWYHWLLVVPVVLAVGFLAYLFGRRDEDLAGTLATELEVVEVKAEAKRRAARDGADDARAWVEERYREKLERLDADRLAEADRLRSNPRALAEFLARVSS